LSEYGQPASGKTMMPKRTLSPLAVAATCSAGCLREIDRVALAPAESLAGFRVFINTVRKCGVLVWNRICKRVSLDFLVLVYTAGARFDRLYITRKASRYKHTAQKMKTIKNRGNRNIDGAVKFFGAVIVLISLMYRTWNYVGPSGQTTGIVSFLGL
jgi:predicted small integral membrane protein